MVQLYTTSSKIYPDIPPPADTPSVFTLNRPETQTGSLAFSELDPSLDTTIMNLNTKLLAALLGDRKELVFRSTDHLTPGIAAEIFDNNGEVLLFARVNPVKVEDRTDADRNAVKFTDNSGKCLFSCSGKEKITIIGPDGRLLGCIRRKDGKIHERPIVMQGLKTNPIQIIEDTGLFFEILFRSDGFWVARIDLVFSKRRLLELKLSFASSLDFNTKAMLIAATYYLNLPTPGNDNRSECCSCCETCMMFCLACIVFLCFLLYLFGGIVSNW